MPGPKRLGYTGCNAKAKGLRPGQPRAPSHHRHRNNILSTSAGQENIHLTPAGQKHLQLATERILNDISSSANQPTEDLVTQLRRKLRNSTSSLSKLKKRNKEISDHNNGLKTQLKSRSTNHPPSKETTTKKRKVRGAWHVLYFPN